MRLRTYLLFNAIFLFPVCVYAGALAVDPATVAATPAADSADELENSEASPTQALKDIKQSLKHAEDSISESNPIRGSIARALFTHDIDGYDPVDEIITFSAKHRKLYFFTDLKDMKGEKIIHRWEYNNSVKATVEFTIAANRYRIHSSKNIQPNETGEWSVVVTNKNGQVLTRNKITVVP